MNRIQKAIILSWLILIGVVVCLYLEWRIVASIMLWVLLYVRGFNLNEKENCRKYFANRKGMMIACVVSMLTPAIWFAYRVFTAPNVFPEGIGKEMGVILIPAFIMMVIYDRWLYLDNNCVVSPRRNQDFHLQ